MTIAHDAATVSSTFTKSGFTFSHTPVGTPKGVVVGLIHWGDATDHISSVSYGSVAMSRVTQAFDPTGGLARGGVYHYHLGASIPTGAQVVTIQNDGTSTITKVACAETFTAAQDTVIQASGTTFENFIDPQVALNSGSTSAMLVAAIFNATNDPSDLSLNASGTSVADVDFGTFVARFVRETNPTIGARSIGFTGPAIAENMAMVALALSEVTTGPGAPTPTATAGGLGRRFRIPEVPSSQAFQNEVGKYLIQVVRQLNNEGFISLFSGTDPNTSGFTGIPGNMLVNIGSASTLTRVWVQGGSVASISTTSWHPLRVA